MLHLLLELRSPKHQLLILITPLLLFVTIFRQKLLSFNLIWILLLIRFIYLGVANPEWAAHTGNDGFLLMLSILALFLIASQGRTIKFLHFSSAIFFIGVIQSVIGAWQLMVYIPDPSTPIKTPVVGTLGTPNGLGLFLVLSVFGGFFLCIKERSVIRKTLIGVGLTMVGAGLILTESRGAWLALLTVLIVISGGYLLQKLKVSASTLRSYKKYIATGCLVAIVLSGLLLYKADEASASGRFMIWGISWSMFEEHPILGIGQGEYSVQYLNYQADFFESLDVYAPSKAANIKQAHNEFIQSFIEGGIIGGILFSLIWLLPFYLFFKLFKEHGWDWQKMCIAAIYLAVIVHSLVDSVLHVLPVAIFGYINLAFVPFPNWSLQLRRFGKSISVIIIIGIYIVYAGIRSYRVYPAYRSWNQGIEYADQQKWDLAITHYEDALQKLKTKGELSYHLGAAMVLNGQYSRGLYFLNQSKKDFNDRNIYLSESYGYLQLDKYEEAIESANVALKMFPDHLAPHLLLGQAYYESKQLELAKESLRKCIELDTRIVSEEVLQIRKDALDFWERNIGFYENESNL